MVECQNTILSDCYPGMDGSPIKPEKVIIQQEEGLCSIIYQLAKGTINITIAWNTCEAKISTILSGFGRMPCWFDVICQANMSGFHGAFRQGFGMCGPSGNISFSEYETQQEPVDSHGLIALKGDSHHLIISADKHDEFVSRHQIQFRKNGFPQMFADSQHTEKRYSAGFRLENIEAEDLTLPVLRLRSFDRLDVGLRDAANEIGTAMKARNHHGPAFHWCSWYYLYYNFCQPDLEDYLEHFAEIKEEIPFQYIQIDAGYFPSCGDWLQTNHRFPEGLRAAFDSIRRHGFKPAIWIGPFMIGNRSCLYQDHPEWILSGLDGKPVIQWKFYGEDHVWGLKDEEYYILDTSHPAAMDYIRTVFRTLREWGAELFKTDFMLWGLQDSTQVKRHTPGKTSVMYFREFLQAVREEIGEESYWLGCIAPFLPFIGYADGMRIAGDVGAQWDKQGFGPENMIQEVVADHYFNNIYWQNDPDAMLLRDFHTHLTSVEIESLALLQAMSGGAVYTSDPVHEISIQRRNFLKFITPRYRANPFLPYFEQDKEEIVLVNQIKGTNRFVILFFNPSHRPIPAHHIMQDLTGHDSLFIRDWKTGEYSASAQSDIFINVPPHGCKLCFATSEGALDREIENLWEWDIPPIQ